MGSSSSKNVASTMAEAIQKTMVNIQGDCTNQIDQTNIADFTKGCVYDTINIDQSNKAMVTADCLFKQIVSNDHKQDISAALSQAAKSVTKGLSAGSSDSENVGVAVAKAVTEDITNISMKCKNSSTQTNQTDVGCARIVNLNQRNEIESLTKCIMTTIASNSTVSKVSAEVKQTASSLTEGFTGMELVMALIAIAVIVAVSGYTLTKTTTGILKTVFDSVFGKAFGPILLGTGVVLIALSLSGEVWSEPDVRVVTFSEGFGSCGIPGEASRTDYETFESARHDFLTNPDLAGYDAFDFMTYDVNGKYPEMKIKPVTTFYRSVGSCEPKQDNILLIKPETITPDTPGSKPEATLNPGQQPNTSACRISRTTTRVPLWIGLGLVLVGVPATIFTVKSVFGESKAEMASSSS